VPQIYKALNSFSIHSMLLCFALNLVSLFVVARGTSPKTMMRRQTKKVSMHIDQDAALVPEFVEVANSRGEEDQDIDVATERLNLEKAASVGELAQLPCKTYVPPPVVPDHKNCYTDAAGSQLDRDCVAKSEQKQRDFDNGLNEFDSYWEKNVEAKDNIRCGLEILNAWAEKKAGLDSAGGNLVKLGSKLAPAVYAVRSSRLPTDATGLKLLKSVQRYLEQIGVKLVADGWSGNMYADPAVEGKSWTSESRKPIKDWENVAGWNYWAGNMVLQKTYHVIRIMATLKAWDYKYERGGVIGSLPTDDQVKRFYTLNIKTQTSSKTGTDYGAVKLDPSGKPFYMGDIWRDSRAASYTSDSLTWLRNAVAVLKGSFDFDLRSPFNSQLCQMLSAFNDDSKDGSPFYKKETGFSRSITPKTVSEC
jgi:hypothetical protein